jgi:prepilin-type N-terminal cleavage/methylation domain-containing protein
MNRARSELSRGSFQLRTRDRAGLTLIEVIVAVMIVSMIGLAIYRFVALNLQVVRTASELTAETDALHAVVKYVQEQLRALPPRRPAALVGEAHLLREKANDEIRWLAAPGAGVLTRHAAGDYYVTMTLRKDDTADRTDLVLRRLPVDNSSDDPNWLKLIEDVRALEIRYYDPRLSTWLENWNAPIDRPTLIRLRLWRGETEHPFEAILSMPPIGRGL